MSDTRDLLQRGIRDYEPTPGGYERVVRRWDRKRRNRRIGALVVATAIIVIGAATFWSAFRSGTVPAAPPVAPSAWIVLSAGYVEPGRHGVELRSSDRDLYVVREGLEPRLIAGSNGDRTDQFCPAVSPDGMKLGFIEQGGGTATLLVAPLDGNGHLGDVEIRVDLHPASLNPCPRWTTDGRRLVVLDGSHVVIVGIDGSLTPLSDVIDVEEVVWSPNGDRIAIRQRSTVSVVDLATGRQEVVADGLEGGDVGQLAWSNFGLAIGASDRQRGVDPGHAPAFIRIVDTESGDSHDVSIGHHGWVGVLSWLPDGRIVFKAGTYTVSVVDPQSDAPPTTLVDHTSAPVLSPDGQWIAYRTYGGGTAGYALFKVPVDGGPPVQVTPWSWGTEYVDFDW